MPFPVIADPERKLGEALSLPTFEIAGLTLYKRLTFVADQGRIVKVFYPVLPPDANAGEVLAYLRTRCSSSPTTTARSATSTARRSSGTTFRRCGTGSSEAAPAR